jgi:hypothetical protein
MHSKAHAAYRSASTAPLVLHHTRIHKCAMKKFGINGQMLNKLFLIVFYCFSLVKAAINADCICKLRQQNALISSFYNGQRWNKDHSALVNCGGVDFLKLR